MRVSKAVMAENNARIITEAARLFRENGIDTTSVAQIMEAAGLTHGGFYRHFESKEALVSAAIHKAFKDLAQPLADNIEKLGPEAALNRFVTTYLTPSHVAKPGKGCPLAAFSAEADRKGGVQQTALQQGRENFVALLAQGFTGTKKTQRTKARGLLALLVGSLVLARGATSPAALKEALAAGVAGAAALASAG